MIDNLSIAFHTFARHMLTCISVDKMLLPKYVNWSTNFRGLSLKVETAHFCLKHKCSVLFVFTSRHPAAYTAVGILLGQVDFREALGRLHSLHQSQFPQNIVNFLPFLM